VTCHERHGPLSGQPRTPPGSLSRLAGVGWPRVSSASGARAPRIEPVGRRGGWTDLDRQPRQTEEMKSALRYGGLGLFIVGLTFMPIPVTDPKAVTTVFPWIAWSGALVRGTGRG